MDDFREVTAAEPENVPPPDKDSSADEGGFRSQGLDFSERRKPEAEPEALSSPKLDSEARPDDPSKSDAGDDKKSREQAEAKPGRERKDWMAAVTPHLRRVWIFIKRVTDQSTISGLALTLFAVTATVALLLSVVNRFTAPVVAEREAAALAKAMSVVLVADEYEWLAHGLYAAKTGGELAGYIAQVTPDGYRGPITMLVAIDTKGAVLRVSIVSHSESPGIGDRAASEAWFLEQFGGRSLPLDYTGLDTISGATVTVKSVLRGVNEALQSVIEYSAGGDRP